MDCTADDGTAEDGMAELSEKGGRYGGITRHSPYSVSDTDNMDGATELDTISVINEGK